MVKSKKVSVVSKECVACGSCVKACPLGAVSVYKGMYAVVEDEKCVGCGSCARACPAGIISIIKRGGGTEHEKALV